MTARRWWFGGGLIVILICSTLWAKQGIIHLKDGTQISGDVTDDPANGDAVSVVIHGVQTTVPRSTIDSIEYPASLDDQFNDRLSKLDPKDVDGRLKLAQWASDNGRYDLARKAATAALELDPGNAAALRLLESINRQSLLTSQTPPAPTPPAHGRAPGPATGPARVAPAAAADKNYLSPDDINMIRQLEMKPTDLALRIQFLNDVRKRYLAQSGEDTREFYAQKLIDQAREILNKGDPAMANDVRVLSDPSALVEYKTRVQPVILSGCATSACHGTSTAAGGFALFTGDDSAAATATNFYILQTYVQKGASAGGGERGPQRRLIDRTYPDKSLLLQYGLPQRVAETPHPTAGNFRQVFTGANDPRYQELVRWMSDSLKPNGGEYPDIHYDRTAGFPATQPGGRPAK